MLSSSLRTRVVMVALLALASGADAQALTWGFVAAPVASGDMVFAADLEGRVYAFKAE